MDYMLLFSEPESAFAERNDPVKSGPYWGAWGAYVQAIEQAGIMVSGAGLQPPHTGTTVRRRDGQRHVQDGPYADTKEQLGGFFVIKVPDLDTALAWAERSPSASYGSVEVRPVLPPPPRG
jgi:hypothetical protein